MESNTTVKVLVLVMALSYFFYCLYWFIQGSLWLSEILLNSGSYVPPTGFRIFNSHSQIAANLMDYTALLGLIARVIGGFYAVFSAYRIFRNNKFNSIKRKLSIILIFEAVYFLSFIPSVIFLLGFSALPALSNILLSAQLIIQVLLIVPMLIFLVIKISRISLIGSVGFQKVEKWAALLFLNYLLALCLSYLLKWFELFNGAQVTFSTVLPWLIENARLLSLLNAAGIFSTAVFFAAIATRKVFTLKRLQAIKYWSLSAFFVGIFFVLYVLYCVYLGALWVIPFGELWFIPLVSVGIYFFSKYSPFK